MKAPTSSSAATTSSGRTPSATSGPGSRSRAAPASPHAAERLHRQGPEALRRLPRRLLPQGPDRDRRPALQPPPSLRQHVAAPLAPRRRRARRAAERGDPAERLEARLPPWFGEMTPLGKVQYLEIATFLEGYLLHTQGDRMLMGHLDRGPLPLPRLPWPSSPRAFRTSFGCGACRRSTCCGRRSSTGCRRRSRLARSAPTARRSSAPSSARMRLPVRELLDERSLDESGCSPRRRSRASCASARPARRATR